MPPTLAGAARVPPASCAVPTLPASRLAPFRFVSPAPLPEKLPERLPERLTPLALFVSTDRRQLGQRHGAGDVRRGH